jgi:hypothetical protein
VHPDASSRSQAGCVLPSAFMRDRTVIQGHHFAGSEQQEPHRKEDIPTGLKRGKELKSTHHTFVPESRWRLANL